LGKGESLAIEWDKGQKELEAEWAAQREAEAEERDRRRPLLKSSTLPSR
jgi:hypothetical protein